MTNWKEKYPETKFIDTIEDFHGTKINDGYRWLEDASNPDVLAWGDKQNELTKKYLDIPQKEKIKYELSVIVNYQKVSPIRKAGNYYFYFRTTELDPQPILYKANSLDFDNIVNMGEEVVINPNTLSVDGTIAVTDYYLTKDGTFLAYKYSVSGSDWQVIKIIDLKKKETLSDEIKDVKFTQIAWSKNNKGFYYSKYPNKDTNYNNKLYYHELFTKQDLDKLIIEDTANKKMFFDPEISFDNEYVIIYCADSIMPLNKLFFYEINNQKTIKLFDKSDAYYVNLGNIGEEIFIITDKNAPNKKVVKFNINNPENWIEVVPESENNLLIAKMTENFITLFYLKDVISHVLIVNIDGSSHYKLDLPLGSIPTRIPYEIQIDYNADIIYFQFDSFNQPESIYQIDIKNKKLLPIFIPLVNGIDLENIEIKQIFYTSKDKKQIPMFIVYKKGLVLDGTSPTLLYAYGGFNIPIPPSFKIFSTFILNYGVFAVANIRGGGEYGEQWHRDGMLEKKQNVFDDFISAGEYLIENNYTSNKKLAIIGDSNGGLLTSVCAIQRPDLFGAVIILNAVIDMLRYHKFTIGYLWMSEYGDPAKSDHFEFLVKYSPLHNIKTDQNYPPMLIKVADTDDTVVPAHSKKFIATLQELDSGRNPILLSIDTKAGHGLGKPITKVIDDYTEIFSFIFKIFDIKLNE